MPTLEVQCIASSSSEAKSFCPVMLIFIGKQVARINISKREAKGVE